MSTHGPDDRARHDPHDPRQDLPHEDHEDDQVHEDHEDHELRVRLRAADPAAGLRPADPDEVDDLLRRVVDSDLRATGTRGRSRLTWLVAGAAAAVLVVAVAATVWVRQVDDPQGGTDGGLVAGPSGSPSTGGTALTVGTASGRCMMPTAELLSGKRLAFAGTVLGVADGVATVRPTEVYAGEVHGDVSLTGAVAPDTGPVVEGDPELVAGQDYLIASDGTTVAGCGMSGPVSPQLSRLYEQAFGR